MNSTKRNIFVACICAVAAFAAVWLSPFSKRAVDETPPAPQIERGKSAAPAPAPSVARGDAAQGAEPSAASAAESSVAAAPETASAGGESAAPSPDEKAQKLWEETLAPFTALQDAPRKVTEQDRAFAKQAFALMTKQHKEEEAHHAMNLLPDETVEILYDILLDPAEDPDVLDIIFSDILNRDEAVKLPVMREIVKMKEHPCFVESARILDIVGNEPDTQNQN